MHVCTGHSRNGPQNKKDTARGKHGGHGSQCLFLEDCGLGEHFFSQLDLLLYIFYILIVFISKG